jgi:hypothetical protein
MRRIVDRSGFLINSHDPLRVHVLKHIRQNSLARLRYSVAEQGYPKAKINFKFKTNFKSEVRVWASSIRYIF